MVSNRCQKNLNQKEFFLSTMKIKTYTIKSGLKKLSISLQICFEWIHWKIKNRVKNIFKKHP